MMSVFLVSVSSTLEGFRNVGWDSFTKCTLYVFQNLWEDPGHSHISSHLTDGLLCLSLLTSSLLLNVCWSIISLCSVTKALKMNIQSRKLTREAVLGSQHLSFHLISWYYCCYILCGCYYHHPLQAFCIVEGLVCPVIMEMFLLTSAD